MLPPFERKTTEQSLLTSLGARSGWKCNLEIHRSLISSMLAQFYGVQQHYASFVLGEDPI